MSAVGRDFFRLLCKKAVSKWGVDKQLDMIVEECAELIDAIQKYKRRRVSEREVLSEGADVFIMLGQLRFIYGEYDFNQEKVRKIRRMAKKLGVAYPC